jgi:hypothetical protein
LHASEAHPIITFHYIMQSDKVAMNNSKAPQAGIVTAAPIQGYLMGVPVAAKVINQDNHNMANVKAERQANALPLEEIYDTQQQGSTYNPEAGETYDNKEIKNHHEGGVGSRYGQLNVNKLGARGSLRMWGRNLRIRDAWVVPRHISCTNLGAGSVVDMRKGQFIYPETTVYTNHLLGSCIIIVPPGVRVVKAGYGILGGFRDHTNKPGNVPLENAPVIRVVGASMLGYTGIEVDMIVPTVKILKRSSQRPGAEI